MNRSFATTLLALAALAATPAAAEAPAPQPIAAEQRCPVCKMYPARYPKWAAQIVFADGAQVAFDSPADLFRFLQNLPRYDGKHRASDVAAAFFADYTKGGWVSREQAFFVVGSKAKGPMGGADLPAFGARPDAEGFARQQGGRVLAHAEVSRETVAALGDGAGHEHHHH